MAELVHEAHPELHHYTTAAGLKGIIESQQLWATNISYLNDAEEHIGFFDRRLSHLLAKPVRAAVAEIATTASDRNQIDVHGGVEKAVEESIKDLISLLRTATLNVDKPYVTAFCSAVPNATPDDGLLSQWRGYGTDGGYAIVFDTHGLERLLVEESKTFHYQYPFILSNVEYYDQITSEKAAFPETLEWEAIVQKTIRNFILAKKWEGLEELAGPIAALSCRYKHSGFREEAEVRIVATPSSSELLKMAQDAGDKRPPKPVHFVTKNGVLVPYIKLFGHKSNGSLTKLPIRKIIVGPHLEKLKRQKAIEVLLEQNHIEARVVVSDIPYLGR